ncbi:MAG: fumarate hydratase [Alkaliphilus sp.]|nr:MAG: fumarate hydratase [Alkaliphilus sp.]
MRKVKAEQIKDVIKELFLKANFVIGTDILDMLIKRQKEEKSPTGKAVLSQIIENDVIASDEKIAMCQDTGYAVVFVELGQEVLIVDGDFNEAINQGVREAYEEGYLRKSVVEEPLFERKNTKDNTPAIVHLEIVPGDKIKIAVTPKGFGSENMSTLKMLKPADGIEGVREFIIETVEKAGPNPCPPIVVGIGIGGTVEKAALIAKKSLLRSVDERNNDDRYARFEEELLEDINKLGIGPAGLGGITTALAVNIEFAPTHIAGLPVVVNICCHAARHAEATI